MSYNEMQKYVNELFEENKQLKQELDTLKYNPQKLLYRQALDAVNYDNEFAIAMLREITEIFVNKIEHE